MVTDTISDMLTRIRNASQANFKTVDIPASNMKKAIAEIRKLIKPDSCIARIRGCYVNEEGGVIMMI